MKRILIVNVNWRGDVLFSTPFIRAIREGYPESFIACMVVPRCRPILENNPHLNELIVFDERGKHKSLWAKLRLIVLWPCTHRPPPRDPIDSSVTISDIGDRYRAGNDCPKVATMLPRTTSERAHGTRHD